MKRSKYIADYFGASLRCIHQKQSFNLKAGLREFYHLAVPINLLFILLIGTWNGFGQSTSKSETIDFNKLSVEFLVKIKNQENTQKIQDTFSNVTIKELEDALDTNQKKLAFWVNIYNAYIQVILGNNPDLYKDRSKFFKADQISFAGEMISFELIEHGIIRGSQWEYGLGFIGKLFPGEFEKRLRVEEPDYRIHFALNCGAKDCPPVAIYEWKRLDEQFAKSTSNYLKRTTEYDAGKKEARVTSLFSWFRGDFGGTDGIKEILKQEGVIPTTKGIDLEYKNYDWTLELDNFATL
ncbi:MULTISPECIES: DUF547 domain-containing protein [Maribacter]|uniref:DUF547 domain-containing protein n=1 Tax=Maribacter flavus TaxID=1658664 RepID=A0A5B2TQC5_9FLAO|nr:MULTISPECIES: DUF547 domain-containing protein [Maribacter]KAA2216757.1 DUF547 domain-containing protein [Maribacter flavus]MDC6406111.1 DUF547 domain-containing protein [Maribacter sp. PR66]MEE1973104.1 DUF547 domain-containing protein [Maribacter flavus]